MDFSNLNAPADVKVQIVTIGGLNDVTISSGSTIGQFKAANNLVGKTIVDQEGNRLNDSDLVREGLQVYVSTPKQNG